MDSAYLVAGLLELAASERPDLLRPLVEALEYSSVGAGVAELAKRWGVGPEDVAAEVAEVAATAAVQLDRLAKRRGGWRHPRDLVADPNVSALADFANARRGRVAGIARARRRDILRRKVERVAEVEHQRRKLDAFLRAPSKPVDLATFMGWRDE